jgi:photosystem II stability/assembly factor-like uncharacterized protein
MRVNDDGVTWHPMNLGLRALTFVSTPDGKLFAGTPDGVFLSTDNGATWVERSLGLSNFHIPALAAAAGIVFAGTWEGEVFQSTDDGLQWRSLSKPWGESPVHALWLLENGDLLAGGLGLRRWVRAEGGWKWIRLSSDNERPPYVRAFAGNSDGAVFAGTGAYGVLASFDDGVTWRPANDGLTTRQVISLAFDPRGYVLAGTDAGVFRAPMPAR